MIESDKRAVDATFTDFKRGAASSSVCYYFTGGLVGLPAASIGMFTLMPLRGEGALRGVTNLSWPQLNDLVGECGSHFVGSNQTMKSDSAVPSETWRASIAPPSGQLRAEDCWSTISHQAHLERDEDYAELARYLSVSIQAAGIRLRGVAKGHHAQLCWALMDGKAAGTGFKNAPLFDLYAEFHSLATELCAARDHLANLAAGSVGAKSSIESMARLVDWSGKPANTESRKVPMIASLLAAWGSDEHTGWLRRLGEMRNQMVHRQPMARNPEAAMLRLVEANTKEGPICTVRLAPSIAGGLDMNDTPDPFVSFLYLYNEFEKLSREISQHAKYPVKLLSMYSA